MDNKKISLKKNFIMNALLAMSSFIFPLISFPYVSRVLQPEGIGKVSMAVSYVAYFNMFAQLGIPTYGIKACAGIRNDHEQLTRTVQEILSINIVTTIITYIVFLITLFTVPELRNDKMLYAIVSLTIVLNTVGMEWLYQSLEQYSYITVRSLIFKAIGLVAMFLMIHNQNDYVIYGGVTIFASSASNVLNLINAHNYVGFKPRKNLEIKRHIKPILIFFAMSAATTVYTNLDTVMLGFMSGNVEVGYYNASVRIKSVLVSVVTSLGAVLLPRSSYYVQHDMMDEFHRVSGKALHFVVLLAFPLALFFILYAFETISFLSGSSFLPSVASMQIIMPTLVFIGLSNITGLQMLIPTGRERVVLISEIGGGIVDLILNSIFIPKFGAAGAAFGTLMAEFVVLMIQGFAIGSVLVDYLKQISYWKIIIALVLGTAGSLWIKCLQLHSFVAIVMEALCFFAIYLASLYIIKEPMIIQYTKQALHKVKAVVKR